MRWHDLRTWPGWARLVLLVISVVLLYLGVPNRAHADNCGPMNGPGGMLWPAFGSCQAWVPGAGGLARVPGIVMPPHNVPYPQTNIATPFWPFDTNPAIPGGPYSPGG
jgi:hypothetical protein